MFGSAGRLQFDHEWKQGAKIGALQFTFAGGRTVHGSGNRVNAPGHPLPSVGYKIREYREFLHGKGERSSPALPGQPHGFAQIGFTVLIHLKPFSMLLKAVIGLYAFPGADLDFLQYQVAAAGYQCIITPEGAIMQPQVGAPDEIAGYIIFMHP